MTKRTIGGRVTSVVGAAALAFGLAFGLGGGDTAVEMVRRTSRRNREEAPAPDPVLSSHHAATPPDLRHAPPV